MSGARSPGRLNFVRWRLILVVPQYGTWFTAPGVLRRLLDFWKMWTPLRQGGCLFPPKFSPYACVKFRRFSYFSYLFSNVYAIQSSDRNMLCWKHYLHPILQLQANAGLPRRSRLLDRQMKVKKLVTLNA